MEGTRCLSSIRLEFVAFKKFEFRTFSNVFGRIRTFRTFASEKPNDYVQAKLERSVHILELVWRP